MFDVSRLENKCAIGKTHNEILIAINYGIISEILMLKINVKVNLMKLIDGNKAKLKRPSLALLWCKSNFLISELGLIAVQITF